MGHACNKVFPKAHLCFYVVQVFTMYAVSVARPGHGSVGPLAVGLAVLVGSVIGMPLFFSCHMCKEATKGRTFKAMIG